MLYSHSTSDIVGLQDLNINKVEQNDNSITIYAQLPRKPHSCPQCGNTTNKIHDYRCQKIKDIPAFGKMTCIMLRKRRYVCNECNKRFCENVPFLPKYHRMTNRLSAFIINKLHEVSSFSSVAREVKVSVSTVIRVFDIVSYPSPKTLPKALAIDEFKGNTGHHKYQCILTDPESHKVLDILLDRTQPFLIKYLKQWTPAERENVQFFISDMWQQYTDIALAFFKESTQIIDRYHFIRQMLWAFDKVRKRIQKKCSKKYRLLFKHSKRLLYKRASKLKDYEKEQINAMLYLSDELRTAYYLKESFYKVVDAKDRTEAKELMSQWITDAENSRLQEYTSCAKTLINWQKGILNSFDYEYTNGFTEGCNNKIKVLKRNAYGYRNFRRFRNRILHIFNN